MRWLFICVALSLAMVAQDAPRHDKYASDPSAYCLAGAPEKGDTHGHQCSCKIECMEGKDGPERAESVTCEMYCSKQLCGCWPEDGCVPLDQPAVPKR